MLHPECHHAYLIRRLDRLYCLVDENLVPACRHADMFAEVRQIVAELRKIEHES